jgi:hypothetical protein
MVGADGLTLWKIAVPANQSADRVFSLNPTPSLSTITGEIRRPIPGTPTKLGDEKLLQKLYHLFAPCRLIIAFRQARTTSNNGTILT